MDLDHRDTTLNTIISVEALSTLPAQWARSPARNEQSTLFTLNLLSFIYFFLSHFLELYKCIYCVCLLYTRSELASLAPSFREHNFVQNTRAIIYNDCAHVRTRMRIRILVLKPHPQSILRGVVCETNVAATCILLRSIS